MSGTGMSSAADSARSDKLWVYLGTYTQTTGKGIYLGEFDPNDGTLRVVGLAGEAKNPSFIAFHPTRPLLYVVSEIADFGGENTGSVRAYSIASGTGLLTLLNEKPSQGSIPCHLVVDHTGRCVLVANYVSGTVACLPIEDDGRLGDATSVIQQVGSSVNRQRQEGPHAHSINVDVANRFAFAADLGADKLFIYRLDPERGLLTAHQPAFVSLKAGAGPRHFAFHTSGRYAYVINELDLTVTAFRYNADQGSLETLQTVSTLPEGVAVDPSMTSSEVQVHPSGKFLYGSNRGPNTIAIFAIDAATGKLRPLGHVSTGGKVPRHFGIDPAGNFLLAANQESDNVVIFRIDQETGKLTPTGQSVSVPKPNCVKFLKPF